MMTAVLTAVGYILSNVTGTKWRWTHTQYCCCSPLPPSLPRSLTLAHTRDSPNIKPIHDTAEHDSPRFGQSLGKQARRQAGMQGVAYAYTSVTTHSSKCVEKNKMPLHRATEKEGFFNMGMHACMQLPPILFQHHIFGRVKSRAVRSTAYPPAVTPRVSANNTQIHGKLPQFPFLLFRAIVRSFVLSTFIHNVTSRQTYPNPPLILNILL